jgi:hypothetical protein
MTSTLATLQNLRTFTFNNHPTDLEEGQLAFNMATENINLARNDANIYMYVGNGSNQRIDEGGTVLVSGGAANKGWIRYRLRNFSPEGGIIYGNLTVVDGKIKLDKDTGTSEIVLPTENITPASSTDAGSLRWNTSVKKLQSWDGSKWDNTNKVTVSDTAPASPQNGDLWWDPGGSGTMYIYIVPTVGPASWAIASSGSTATALQPGNGVTANFSNEIDTINSGSF